MNIFENFNKAKQKFGENLSIRGTGFEVNPESWTQLKGSNEKGI